MVAGIPTTYRYNAMRSRLEARWAVFFDLIGWAWTYEPLDADGYIPDFLVDLPRSRSWPMFVEVGPVVGQSEYEEKAEKADRAVLSLGRDVLIAGVSPIPNLIGSVGGGSENPEAGWLGEYNSAFELDYPVAGRTHMEAGFAWNTGCWGRCYECKAIGVVHSEMSYCLRPCGHHQSGSFGNEVSREELTDLWAQAGSRVQWKAPVG